MNKQEKILLFILASIQFCHSIDFMIIMPLGPQLMRILAITPSQFGLLVSSYTFGAGIMGLAGVFFLDKLDRKSALKYLFIGFAGGTLACAFAKTYYVLLSMRALTGAFGGLLSSTILSIIGDVFPFEMRGRAVGIVMGAFSIAAVIGVPFGLFLASFYNWEAPFLFLGFLSMPILFFIYTKVPELKSHLHNEIPKLSGFEIYKSAVTEKDQHWALLFISALVLGQFTVIPYVSPSMVANVGFSESQLAWIYLVGGLLTIFTSQMIGKASDKFGKRVIFNFFIMFSILPLLIITNLSTTPLPVALIFTSLFFITVGGRMIPAMSILSSTVPSHRRGSFMGLVNSVQQFSAAIAAFIAGQILIKEPVTGHLLHYNYVGYIAVFFSLVSLFCLKKFEIKY